MELVVLYQEPKGEDLDCHSSFLDDWDFLSLISELIHLIDRCKKI